MLAGNGDSTWIIANAMRAQNCLSLIVLEEQPSFKEKVFRRIRKLGYLMVMGQLIFQLYYLFLKIRSKRRIYEILEEGGLDTSVPSDIPIVSVRSVNCDEVVALLVRESPAVVVINGTRILSGELLSSVSSKFVNLHAGITPKYRGVHGGYWALAMKDNENAGVTVHLVDEGIDTGEIIFQGRIEPGKLDNFATYPYLQLRIGVPLLLRAVNDLRSGGIQFLDTRLPSHLFYHPTIWAYIHNRFTRGVR